MNEKILIPIAKHLKDEDDLFQGRDAKLAEGQEENAQKMVEAIQKHVIENGFKTLVFCVSPKKRAVQTAKLIQNEIRRQSKLPKILIEVDNDLREIDQG